MAKPTVIVIYNDPNNKLVSRLVYQPNDADIDPQRQYQVVVEESGIDGLGNARWAPAQNRFPYEITLAEAVAALVSDDTKVKVDRSTPGLILVDMTDIDFGPR